MHDRKIKDCKSCGFYARVRTLTKEEAKQVHEGQYINVWSCTVGGCNGDMHTQRKGRSREDGKQMARYIDADLLQKEFVEYSGKRSLLVDTAPTADVRENVRGTWVGIDDEPFTVFECDTCGYDYEHIYGEQSNFCPNCGADMKGESE